jgi:outer membrane protein assembly factor BamA
MIAKPASLAGILVGCPRQVNGAECQITCTAGQRIQLARRLPMLRLTAPACCILLLVSFAHAQCAKDHRTNKNNGILISDFVVTGTQTLGATELARITGNLTGSCFDEDSEEMGERVRAEFQDRGYFAVEVKSVRLKPSDPLRIPKPVTMEAEVSEGPRYRTAEITFLENHEFSSEQLREAFPLKHGNLFERDKVASGLENLRKLYQSAGYLDFLCIPETTAASNATMALKITVQEGPQYHMGKLDILANKQLAARLRANWTLSEGSPYEQAYIDEFIAANRDLLPEGFTGSSVQTGSSCPDAKVDVRLMIDPTEDSSSAPRKNVPCEDHDRSKQTKNN